MSLLAEELAEALSHVELDQADRRRIAAYLLAWFDEVPKKLNIPQQLAAKKIADFRKKLAALANDVELKIAGTGVTATATGESAQTLQMVQHGSLWFPAFSDVAIGMLAAASQDS